MLSSREIREVKFSRSVAGYKQEEVDILLDKVEADYEQNEKIIHGLQEEIKRLNGEIESYKSSHNSIQSVLLNAQRLSDQMVAEAKERSAAIISEAQASVERFSAREKELSAAFEEKAVQRKATVDSEIEKAVTQAQKKVNAMQAAANNSVERQKLLFDKIKIEIATFKNEITMKYKDHLERIAQIPDEVPMDPKAMADAVTAVIDSAPSPEEFIKAVPVQQTAEPEKTQANSFTENGFVLNDVTEAVSADDKEDNS